VAPGSDRSDEAAAASWRVADYYDAAYYEHRLESPYRWDNPTWTAFFDRIADFLVDSLEPHTVLDVGCGVGFLVHALRSRGIDARGVDISEYALSQVPTRIAPYCVRESITDRWERNYDLITCIDVLEHLPAETTTVALDNLALHTDRILVSLSPGGTDEPAHGNLQPVAYWVRELGRRGFFPSPESLDGIVLPRAMLFERRQVDPVELAATYESLRWELEADPTRQERRLLSIIAELEIDASTLGEQLQVATAELEHWRATTQRSGWRLFVGLSGMRRRLGPPGTARDRALRHVLRALAGAADGAHTRFARSGAAGAEPETPSDT